MIPVTNMLNNRYTQVFNSVRIINVATTVATQVPRALPGAIAGDSLPLDQYHYQLWRSASRGKSYRGNKKFGPVSESNTTHGADDLFNAAFLVLSGLVATAVLANLTDSDGNVWAPIILSKNTRLGAQYRSDKPISIFGTQVASILLAKRVGTMKKRKVQTVY